MEILPSLFLLLALPASAGACGFAKASYTYTGDASVTARFDRSDKLSSGWLSDRYVEVTVGNEKLYFLFDRGSARQINLISSENPQAAVPAPDGGVRPYGSVTFISWDRRNRVDESIPHGSPPEFFLIPELPEKLMHAGSKPIPISPGIFELHCK